MTEGSKNLNTNREEEKENSTQQDQSTEASKRVGELRRRKYYTRATKTLQEEICERQQSTKKHREDILKSKNTSKMEAKKYKQTFPCFKEKMLKLYGETFYYNTNGGPWHGEMSRRYQYHIGKSMRFLNENMNNSDDE